MVNQLTDIFWLTDYNISQPRYIKISWYESINPVDWQILVEWWVPIVWLDPTEPGGGWREKKIWKSQLRNINTCMPQATAKLYDVSYWFLSTTRICVWKENTISIVPTNIFWVFFTLLFNPNHPNLDPQYSHPISSAKTSAKCQAMTKTFWNNWRKQV